MPTLKHLTCNVEWASSRVPLAEFQTAYADGYVETYIAVPSFPTPFEIHLTSNGYIAPGLAMFVFMDGVYQCNRNRQNLQIPGEGVPKNLTEIDFHVNQKERQLEDGNFHGRDWRFEKVNIVEDSDIATEQRAPYDGEYVGIIDVVVLRCFPDENATRPGTPQSSIDATSIKSKASASVSNAESQTDGSFSERLVEDVAEIVDTAPAMNPAPSPPSLPPPTAKRVHKAKPKADNSRFRGMVRIRGGNGNSGSETKPVQKGVYRIRHRSTQESKATLTRLMLGLDGTWDWNGEVNKTSSNHPPWNRSTASKASRKKETSESRTLPIPRPRHVPISSKEEHTRDKVGKSCDNTALPTNEPEKHKTKLTSTTTGKCQRDRIPANSSRPLVKRKAQKYRSDTRATFSKDWGATPPAASPDRGRSRKPRSPIGHRKKSPLMTLRGGGPGSYSASSVNGAATPSVVVNVSNNNNNGPPPPSDWQAKREEFGKTRKAAGKKTTPAKDSSTTYPSAHNPKQDSGLKKTKKELKKERKQKRNQMPGSWDTSNEQDRNGGGDGDATDNNYWDKKANDDSKKDSNGDWEHTKWNDGNDQNKTGDNSGGANNNWDTTGNNDNQDDKNDWNNTGADTWDAAKNDAQNNDNGWDDNNNNNNNDDGWDNNNNNNNDDGWNNNNNNNNDDGWDNGNNNNNNNDERHDDSWGNNGGNDSGGANGWDDDGGGDNTQETSGWDNNNNEEKDSWDTDKKDKSKVTVGAKDPATLKPSKNNPKPKKASKKKPQKAFDFDDWSKEKPAKASSSKAASKRTPSPKSILKPPSPHQPSLPFTSSPPLPPTRRNSKTPPTRRNSKTPPPKPPPNTTTRTNPHPRPILSITTSPNPHPQPYWSTWSALSPTSLKIAHLKSTTAAKITTLLTTPTPYSIPVSLHHRSNISHQISPGRSTTYRHRRGVPRYMDEFQTPYAVFRFQYRDRGILERMTGTRVVEGEGEERGRLGALTKEELIEAFVRVRGVGDGSGSGSGGATWRSWGEEGEGGGPDVRRLDERLRRLETGGQEEEEEEGGVAGWLADTVDVEDDGGEGVEVVPNWGKKGKGKKGKGKGKGNADTDTNTNTKASREGKHEARAWDDDAGGDGDGDGDGGGW